MNDKEKGFLQELGFFEAEVETAIQFFYTYRAIHDCLSKNQRALRVVNRTPLFWRTNAGALQASFFMTLGRIFDDNGRRHKKTHNVGRLLTLAQDNMDIFSRASLLRGRGLSGEECARPGEV